MDEKENDVIEQRKKIFEQMQKSPESSDLLDNLFDQAIGTDTFDVPGIPDIPNSDGEFTINEFGEVERPGRPR